MRKFLDFRLWKYKNSGFSNNLIDMVNQIVRGQADIFFPRRGKPSHQGESLHR